MTDASPPPRRWRLRFSLRMLLLVVTAFAIGFPIWYRWPFEETEYRYPGGDKTKPPIGSSLKTWRRTWGGGKVQHGRTVTESTRDATKTIEHFEEGKRHGKYEAYRRGTLIRTGQYEDGKREGTWFDYAARTTHTAR